MTRLRGWLSLEPRRSERGVTFVELIISIVLLSMVTGACDPSVKTTTASRLPGLLNTTRGPSASTSAPRKLAFSAGVRAG